MAVAFRAHRKTAWQQLEWHIAITLIKRQVVVETVTNGTRSMLAWQWGILVGERRRVRQTG